LFEHAEYHHRLSERAVKNEGLTPMTVDDLVSNVEETKEETKVNLILGKKIEAQL
jgi:hypothetical protein